jgi:hypothetical protein
LDREIRGTLARLHGKMTLPGIAFRGARVLRSVPMKINWFDASSQVSAVHAPGMLLTLVMFRLKRVPEPDSGVKPFE